MVGLGGAGVTVMGNSFTRGPVAGNIRNASQADRGQSRQPRESATYSLCRGNAESTHIAERAGSCPAQDTSHPAHAGAQAMGTQAAAN